MKRILEIEENTKFRSWNLVIFKNKFSRTLMVNGPVFVFCNQLIFFIIISFLSIYSSYTQFFSVLYLYKGFKDLSVWCENYKKSILWVFNEKYRFMNTGQGRSSCQSSYHVPLLCTGVIWETIWLSSAPNSQKEWERPLLFLVRDHVCTQKPCRNASTPKLLEE